MKGSVPAIVEAMVEKAKQGSCTHAKTLLEMTGAKHMFGDGAEIADSGEPWAKLVLERMDEAEQESLKKDAGRRWQRRAVEQGSERGECADGHDVGDGPDCGRRRNLGGGADGRGGRGRGHARDRHAD